MGRLLKSTSFSRSYDSKGSGYNLNHKLYVVRRENNWYQKDVAKKLNMHSQTYHLKESGKKDFTLTEAKRLAMIFNRSLDTLFGDERESK